MTDEQIGNAEAFDALLREFGAQSGREDLALDEDGHVAVTIGDDVIVNVFADAGTSRAFAVATVGAAAEGREGETCLRLLEAHAHGAETGGFTVALESAESGRIAICDRRPFSAFDDWRKLAGWLGGCANVVRRLRGQLGYGDPDGRSDSEFVIYP